MDKCKHCNKKLTTLTKLNMGIAFNDFCSHDCRRKYKKMDKENKDKVKEIKCKCNKCGKVWHYLEQDEKRLKSQALGNTMVGCGMCCNPFGALFLNKSIESSRKAGGLSKCPDCKSIDVKKTPKYHEKK